MTINIGDVFGDFKVLSRNYDKNAAARYWNCECIYCKSKRILRSDSLKKNYQCKKCKDPLIGTHSNEFLVLKKINEKSLDRCNMFLCECQNCGHQEKIASNVIRSQRKHCSICYQKKTTLIDITGQHFGYLTVLYQDLSPEHQGHEKDSYWICKCENCGSIKSIRSISLRKGLTKSCGCIKSYGEEKIAKILTDNNINFQREYTFPDLVYKQPLRFDFAVFTNDNKLSHLIEFDGIQHFETRNSGWNTQENLEKTQIRDLIKNNYCKENNIKLNRIKYDEEITLERIMDKNGID